MSVMNEINLTDADFALPDLLFEKMSKEHIEAVFEIEKSCFDTAWSKTSLEGELDNPNAYYIVALKNDEVVGYGGFHKVDEEAQIMNIAVKKSSRGNGIGKKLLIDLLNLALRLQIHSLTLEVKKSNEIAQKLYKSVGFENEGERPKYYPNGESAVIMWLRF